MCKVTPVILHGAVSPEGREACLWVSRETWSCSHTASVGVYPEAVPSRRVDAPNYAYVGAYDLLGVEYDPLAT